MKSYAVEHARNGILILNFSLQNQFDMLMAEIKHYISGDAEKEVAVGIGGLYKNLDAIALSYQEAVIAADYRLIKGMGNIIRYEEIKNSMECYYYPVDDEYLIGNHLNAGSYEQAIDRFHEILGKNLERDNLSVHALKLFFFGIELTALRTIEQMGLNKELHFDPNDIYKYQAKEELTDHIERVFADICRLSATKRKNDHTELKDAVIQYVDRSYSNEQISLSMVAEAFNVSPSYISRFFKEQLDYNFLEYVNRKRIELAKEQLCDQTLDINTISRAVGYDNTSSFRRIFKKYVGISPSEYRCVWNGRLCK